MILIQNGRESFTLPSMPFTNPRPTYALNSWSFSKPRKIDNSERIPTIPCEISSPKPNEIGTDVILLDTNVL